MHMPQCIWHSTHVRSEDNLQESALCLWVLGIKLRSAGLAVGSFATKLCHQPPQYFITATEREERRQEKEERR